MSARAELPSISFSRASSDGSVVAWRMFNGSHRHDSQALHSLEVPPVIGEQREVVTDCGRADQQVEVANGSSGGPQSASLASEYPAHGIVYRHYVDGSKKLMQCALVAVRIR